MTMETGIGVMWPQPQAKEHTFSAATRSQERHEMDYQPRAAGGSPACVLHLFCKLLDVVGCRGICFGGCVKQLLTLRQWMRDRKCIYISILLSCISWFLCILAICKYHLHRQKCQLYIISSYHGYLFILITNSDTLPNNRFPNIWTYLILQKKWRIEN